MIFINNQNKMSSNTITNKFRISNFNYDKDNVFDNFDIADLISNDFKIPKASLNNFLYYQELNKKEQKKPKNKYKHTDEVIHKINQNHFNIKIDKLVIKYPNDYKVKFISLYTPIKFIGQGSFGLVLSVIKNETKEKFAVKIIQKDYRYSSSTYLNEVKLLKKFNHQRIMKLHEVLDTEDYLFLFVDLIEGGSLKDFIIERYKQKEDYFIKDSECSIIVKSILEGVDYLNKNNVMHRDLKPENIMFKNKNDLNSLIICDFGIACEISNYSFIKSKCGTLIYMAPEMVFNRPYDHLVDVWSIGIIMYILESGGMHPLFSKDMEKELFIEELRAKKKWNFPSSFPFIARNFFMKVCKHEPLFRYQTNKALRHPWITRNPGSKIPLTLVEAYEKEDKVKNFKSLLGTMIFLKIYKKEKLTTAKCTSHTHSNSNLQYNFCYSDDGKIFISPNNSSFGEIEPKHLRRRSKNMPIANKNKIIELLLTPIKKDIFNSTRGFYNSNIKSLRGMTTNRYGNKKISFFNNNHNNSGNKTVKEYNSNKNNSKQIGRYDSQKNISNSRKDINLGMNEIKSPPKEAKEDLLKPKKGEAPMFLKVNKSPVKIMNKSSQPKRKGSSKNQPTNNKMLLLLREIKTCREKEKSQIMHNKNSFINSNLSNPRVQSSYSFLSKLSSTKMST